MDPRSVDPTTCWIRHVVRGADGDPSAVQLGRVWFVRTDAALGQNLNGQEGWQQAETTLVLSDDGSFSLIMPNTIGSDGILHRRRFRCLTESDYEPGEEWIEFWSDVDQERPFFVGTPTDGEKTKAAITIKGADVNAVLAGFYSSEADPWEGAAPADVFAHYSRMPVLAVLEQPAAEVSLPNPFTTGPLADGASYHAVLDEALASPDCWIVESRIRWTTRDHGLVLIVGNSDLTGALTMSLEYDASTDQLGAVQLGYFIDGSDFNFGSGGGKKLGLAATGLISLRVVVRYDRVFAFVNGTLAADLRRSDDWFDVEQVWAGVGLTSGGDTSTATPSVATVEVLQVEELAPFAGRGSAAAFERRLPGIPPADGLRGRYWNGEAVMGDGSLQTFFAMRMFPGDPTVDRLDSELNFPVGTADFPPNLPGIFSARWTGAIYLDLEAADRKLRISGLSYSSQARVWVGRTRRDEPAASSWGVDAALVLLPATITTDALRDWIGESESGWYTIVVEYCWNDTGYDPGLVLEDTALDGGGAPVDWDVVPESRLSPIGGYDDTVRYTSHRNVIGDVAQTFGYQWRARPQSLESGQFPAQLEVGSLIGFQTDIVVDDDVVGTDVVVQTAAGDVVDALLVDAAGISDPDGTVQLTLQGIDYERAAAHMALRQSYESLSDITEAPLLQTRVESLLALRSSPNEQVGVRPRGQVDLAYAFALDDPELAKMLWEPADGLRLDLDSVDVKDASPRQLVVVTRSPRPDGLGIPVVGFRQRPRTPAAALKRLRAAIYGPRRTYQGQRAIVTGSPGGTSAAGVVDEYSRAPLPANLADVARVVAVVQEVTGTTWHFEIDGVDQSDFHVSAIGRYDITSAVVAGGVGQPFTYARLVGGAGGDTYLMTLELVVRV